MTVINLATLATVLGGTTPIDATLDAVPWAGRGPASRTAGDTVVVPDSISLTLTDGLPDEDFDLEPTDGTFCWRIILNVPRAAGFRVKRYVTVPEVGPVDWEDLVDVDPATFAPSLEAVAAWEAAIAEVQAIADEMAASLDPDVAALVPNIGTATGAALAAKYAPKVDASFTASSVGTVPVTVQAINGQAVDVFRVNDKDGVPRVRVTNGNVLYAPQFRAEGTQVANVPLVVEGASGLTADIAKFRAAPGGSDLARIRLDGRITSPNLTELVYNVKDYGAKGDGTTSDTTNIQSAITAATAAGGGVVYFPAGTYMINAFVGLKDRVSIRGAGADVTILKAKTGLTTGVLVAATGDTVSDITISGLTIDGDYSTTAASIQAFQLTTVSRVTVHDCTVKNMGRIGFLIQTNSSDVTVRGCRIDGTGLADAANGFGVRILQSQRCKVWANRIFGARGMGINAGDTGAAASRDTEIIGNYIDMASSTTYEAIGVTADSVRTVINANHCVNNNDNGISATASDSVVTSNIIDGAQNSGIYLGGSNSVCSGNWVRNSGLEVSATTFGGITISATSQNCVVTGNRCFDDQGTKTQDYGVKESPGADYNLITGNQLRGNLTAGVLLSGANSISTNNIV